MEQMVRGLIVDNARVRLQASFISVQYQVLPVPGCPVWCDDLNTGERWHFIVIFQCLALLGNL